MNQKAARGAKRFRAKLLTWALLCAACGLALWPPGGCSRAQQQARQLVQTDGAASGKRLALVVGNGAYTNAPALKNPPNDARDMADALSRLGFTVEHGVDLNQRQMKSMIREFGQKLKGGGQGLFYYAGHGVQLKGKNYLIPVDADIQSETDVEDQGVDANLVLGFMDEAGNGLNIVILDACRNNPFARSFRSASSGLAQVDAPTGTLIAYATAPGRVARDGAGRNGAYTAELLRQMQVPGLSVEELLKRVRVNLKQQTKDEQVPWESSSLVGDFYLNRAASTGGAVNTPPSKAEGTPPVDSSAIELAYWDTIKNSSNAEDFRAYLRKYPKGEFADLAKNRLNKLESKAREAQKVSAQESPARSAATIYTVTVYANQGWQDTGIIADSGSTIVFEHVSGTWTTAKGLHPFVGANGNENIGDPKNPNHPLPTAYPGVLIGKVGNGLAQRIGASGSLQARFSGKIYMRMNDDGISDNEGYLVLRVTVRHP